MNCGTFNFGCQIQAFIAPWWFWIQVGFWTFVGLVALWVLAKVKGIGGWPALGATLVAAAGLAGYAFRARQDARGGQSKVGGYYLTPDDRKAVQRALAARHLYPGDIDGEIGTQTRAGIRTLQRNMNPPEDETGTITPRVLKALGLKFG